MKVVVAAFQEKALVGAFSVITNLRIELFESLVTCDSRGTGSVDHVGHSGHPSIFVPIMAPISGRRPGAI